jgi:glutamate-1-semialdehyde 2,1-aminomutase
MEWDYLDSDRELFERELASFMPTRIFDAHAHLYDLNHVGEGAPRMLASGPSHAGYDEYQRLIGQMAPGRQPTGGLFFPFPSPQVDVAAANAFVGGQVRSKEGSRGQMLIRPEMDAELIRETVRRESFVGLKCYHVFSRERPTFSASIGSYLPESHVRVAHEEGLTITLHMVRPRAMADDANQQAIRRFAEKYPNARFILAHAARGFNPHHTIEGIGSLRGLRNIWCDTSAITDSGAFEAVIRTLGVDRLLYGSDFPVSHLRGRCVAMGDSFIWLTRDNLDLNQPIGTVVLTLVGLESLRTLKLACWNLGLSDSQVEQIFYGNAAELFGLQSGKP